MIIPVPNGGGKAYAVIIATYEAGSTCTCTNGQKRYKAKDTSGKWMFLLPSGGEWTVAISDSTHESVYRSVTIERQYQIETVVISYETIIYDAGAFNTDILQGFKAYKPPNTAVKAEVRDKELYCEGYYFANQHMPYAWLYSENQIDLTNVNRIDFSITQLTQAAGIPCGGMVSTTFNGKNASLYKSPTDGFEAGSTAEGVGILSVDVKNLSGLFTIVFGTCHSHTGTSQAHASITCNKITIA